MLVHQVQKPWLTLPQVCEVSLYVDGLHHCDLMGEVLVLEGGEALWLYQGQLIQAWCHPLPSPSWDAASICQRKSLHCSRIRHPGAGKDVHMTGSGKPVELLCRWSPWKYVSGITSLFSGERINEDEHNLASKSDRCSNDSDHPSSSSHTRHHKMECNIML